MKNFYEEPSFCFCNKNLNKSATLSLSHFNSCCDTLRDLNLSIDSSLFHAKKVESNLDSIFFGARKETWTLTAVNNSPLKRARLPIPPSSHITLFVLGCLTLDYYIPLSKICKVVFWIFQNNFWTSRVLGFKMMMDLFWVLAFLRVEDVPPCPPW